MSSRKNVLMTIAAFSMLGALTSCKQLDNMENMNNKTNELASTSNKISKTSNQLADQTAQVLGVSEELRRNTGDLYHQARSKEAEETRQRAREALDSDTSFEEKVTRSAIYFKSFEVQLWTNKHASQRDDDQFRDELKLEAVEEFFRTVQSFYEAIGSDHDISASSTDISARALFALSVTMHETHYEQKRLLDEAKGKVKEVTMLNMIEETLKKSEMLKSGALTLGDLEAYEIAILENEPSARNLLRMRFDILSAMTLAKVSKINDPNHGTVSGFFTQARLYLRNWDSDFPKLNLAQQHQVETFLGEAIRMKGVLKSLQINSALESKIGTIYENMKLPSPSATCADCLPKNDVGPLKTHHDQIKELLK